MSIAYLGPAGSWSEAAALHQGDDLLACRTLPEIVAAVEDGRAERGVLPIENALEGAVTTTLDLLLHETDLRIVAEVVVPIRHLLLVNPGTQVDQIRVVRSHPQALAQCRHTIARALPQAMIEMATSTAAAVESLRSEPYSAAIASARAAELYPVEILARDFQDQSTNETRFVVLAASDATPTGHDKTSLAFAVAHWPGALVQVLQIFADAQINLVKLESRPARERLGQYIFLCDLEGHRDEPLVAEALERVVAQCDWFKLLGSYPRFSEQ